MANQSLGLEEIKIELDEKGYKHRKQETPPGFAANCSDNSSGIEDEDEVEDENRSPTTI